MIDLSALGRILLIIAVILMVVALAMLGLGKVTGGRWLPGDIVYSRGQVKIFFPIVTSLLVSILLTILLNVILRFMRK